MKLLSATTLLVLASAAIAGDHGTLVPAKPEPKANPLSFLDGALVLDVEERVRFEARNNTRDFNDSINDDNDDTWLLNRFRFGLAVRPARWLKLYAQFQDVREWDSDRPNVPGVRGTEGGDSDLRQGYVELANYEAFPLGLTVGRQSFFYGDGRLIGDPRWNNFGRTFDAVKLRFQTKAFWLDAFASRPVQMKEEVFNDRDAADNLFGLYGGTEALGFQTTELYFFYRDKGDAQPDLDPTNKLDPRGTWNGPAQRIATVGTRWQSQKGGLHGWDYTVEAAFQWGDVWTPDRSTPALDHHAFAAHVSGGYTFEKLTWHPRIGLEYDYASGDRDPADGRSESFQNLLASNHEKYGYMDEFAWRNLHDFRVQLKVDVIKDVQAELNYHALWLADTNDYWFRSNGVSTVRTTTPDGRDVRRIGADRFAGHELDFVVKWFPAKWLQVDAGYSHFFAGDYLGDTGTRDDADFGYVQATVKF
ncbi:MAG: alginate export family protein [Chthoniobacteraceae bacterium]